jgi:hypothetical protein
MPTVIVAHMELINSHNDKAPIVEIGLNVATIVSDANIATPIRE